ncbi:thymidine kinase-like [Rhododendron vialii]|uniref:thymidine kinase-like n=1 Tax=Rhododendron vialii TaxID=182163 RepID=UPI00265E83D2|nr:thymidine kinase-like [Rhododendron vialii]
MGVKFSIFICFWRLKYLSSPKFRLKQKFHALDTSSPLFTSHQYRFRASLEEAFVQCLIFIPLVDSITKPTAQCELCGKRAFFTLRKIGETKMKLIGSLDVYMLVCHQHYDNGQVVE